MHDTPPSRDDPRGRALADALRESTRECHAQVEGRLDLLSPTLTHTRYVGHLETLLAFVRGWEAVPGMQRERLGWGRALGRAAVLEREITSLASRFSLPTRRLEAVGLPVAAGRWPGAVGAHYVMEGSALGARSIDAHLRSHFAWYGPAGGGYFQWLAASAARRWRRFRAFLSDVERERHGAIVETAVMTFAALAAHLRRADLGPLGDIDSKRN